MGSCQETAGFLFKHPCSRDATAACGECSKELCQKHTKQVGGAGVCVECARVLLDKQATGGRRGGNARERYGDYADDPYFYGWSYYDGYGQYRSGWGREYYAASRSDAADFSEADGESFGTEGDEGFERDMGAS